jgi:hypothetical protein
LKISFNNCKTWEHARLLEECGGYSDLAFSPNGQWLYIFYEHDIDGELYSQPRYLTFARLNLEWLTDSPNDKRSKP